MLRGKFTEVMVIRTSSQRLILILLGLTIAVKLAISFWGLDRGFDVGDEGNYIYTAKFISHYRLVSDYFYLISFVYDFLGIDIISARILRIVSEVTSVFIFSIGLFYWVKSRHSHLSQGAPGFLLIFLFCCMGAFLSVYSRGFSYNDLSNLLLYSALSGFLYVESLEYRHNSLGVRAKLVMGMIGFILGWQLLIKFPGSILFLSLFMLYLTVKNIRLDLKIGMILALILGYLVSLLIFFDLYGNVHEWFAKLFAEMELDDQNVGEILAFYISVDYPLLIIVPLGVALFFLIAGILRKMRFRSSSRDTIYTLAFVISVPVQIVVHLCYPYNAPGFQGF